MANRLVASPISSAVCCLALLAAASARSLPTNGTPAGNYTSNTQQCIVSSPKLEACAHLPFGGDSATWWSLGGHLLQCCSALREFNKPGCFWCLPRHHAAPSDSPVQVQRRATVYSSTQRTVLASAGSPAMRQSATSMVSDAPGARRVTTVDTDCGLQQPYGGGVRPCNRQPDQGAGRPGAALPVRSHDERPRQLPVFAERARCAAAWLRLRWLVIAQIRAARKHTQAHHPRQHPVCGQQSE